MSTRLLRKVLEEQERRQQQNSPASIPEVDDVEADNDEESPSVAPSRNPFDLLDDDKEDGQRVRDRDEDDLVEEDGRREPLPIKISSLEGMSSPSHKSKRKKKKAKNGSMKKKGVESVDLKWEELSISTKTSDDQGGCSGSKSVSHDIKPRVMQKRSSVLAVDPKHLKAENELRKIFGSKVVNSFENKQSFGGSRQIIGGRRTAYNPRKMILVSPLGHWPRWDGSLSMELLETKDGIHHFRYVHSQSYSYVQEAFEAAKATHDLNAIGNILGHQPYHIGALLTFADVFKFSGEHQSSSDAIGKCLFALECAWHPLFSPMQGNFQLKYNHDTNKPLFSALFSHMKNMDRRGCHRSALEVCKLLLSLDSDDPVGALFCIDYFSLRAQEYPWLEQFSEEYRSDNSLWLFPNFSYSLAVCRYYLEHETANEEFATQTEKASSNDLMKQALMLHPLVLKKLVDKAPLKDSAWTKILRHPFFGSAKAGSPSLEHLISIYVERNYLIWRFPELQNFLKEAALSVIESLKNNNAEVRDWSCIRREAFSSEKNEYSHLLISDFSDAVPSIPPEELRQFMVGPHMLHEQHDMQNGNIDANPERARAVREIAADRNPAVVFLESLLPWIDYGTNRNNQPHRDNPDIQG